ncbi:MAG: toxin TcdB middle/N-terminal domain-containing protein, partial [Candidatus Omnitrophota bacterium]|nr:toxin TcdB middle/N-terminal domain-containing protein [Candidatus Omnitrophota bacterium]
MKKVLFKIISLILIFAHLSAVCLRDVGFAEEVQHIPPVPEGVDFNQLGRVPDTIGHGQPAQWVENVPIAAGSFSTGATEEPTGASFQKDILTSGDKFNHILDSLSADSFTGKAQMTIPIFFPGTNRDIKPPLSVVYNSGAGNGLLGVGWSLDLGAISRSAKKGVPKYSPSDIFIAQGQELSGIGGNEYRSKIEGGFVRYIFNGSSWQAIDKSGTKYFFGSSDNSRIVTSKGIYSWALDKISDLKGNYLVITYIKEENKLYPQYIAYTGNEISGLAAQYKISFSYEDRPDISLSYIIGEKIKLLKRLWSIDILFGNDLMRRYILEYGQSPSTKKSLLTKVKDIGSDGSTASPPVILTYRSNTGGWSADQPKWHIPDGDFVKSGQDQGRRLYDLNGDGMTDFVISCYAPDEPSDRQSLRQTFLNSKDGFSASPNWWPVPIGYFAYKSDAGSDDGRRLVDLTGDGIPELLAANFWESSTGINGQYKDAYEFKYLDNQNPQWVQNSQWNLPDGFFVYGQNGGIRIWISLIVNIKPRKVDGGKRFADLNGDGLNDLSVAEDSIIMCDYFPSSPIPRSINAYINTGSRWQQDNRWNSPDGYFVTSSGDGGRRLTDINGDGLADWLVACDGYKATYLNTGSGWVRNDAFNIPDGDFSSGGRDQGRMLVDINGDGLNDLVVAKDGYHAVYLNTGFGWRRDDSFNLPDGDFVDSDGRDQGRYLADLDGDSIVDICIAKDGYKKAYLNLSGPADLLIKATNGLGGESTIEYTPSTRYYHYYPNKTGKLPFAIPVVSKVTVSDGQDNSYSTAYSYKDGYFNAAEREFRGFGYV